MTERPTFIDYDGLMSCARGEMFGPGNPQLPAPPMLMMDRITDISADRGSEGKGHVVAEFDVRPDLWFFQCHFLGDPVMPGCLGLDALWQLTGFNLGWRGMQGRGRALGVGEVKFTGMVTPVGQAHRVHGRLHPGDRPQAEARHRQRHACGPTAR